MYHRVFFKCCRLDGQSTYSLERIQHITLGLSMFSVHQGVLNIPKVTGRFVYCCGMDPGMLGDEPRS